MPPTVISRCRKVNFGFLGDGEVAEVLVRKGWEPREAAAAAGLAEGSPGSVLSLGDDAWKRADKALRGLDEKYDAHDPVVYFSFALVAATWWWVFRSQPGLQLRSAGERPEAGFARGVNRDAVVALGRDLGFSYVSVDLAGYRTGSMNEVLKAK